MGGKNYTEMETNFLVDEYLFAYEYAFEKLTEKQKQEEPRTNTFLDAGIKGGLTRG